MTGPLTIDASVVVNAFRPGEPGQPESQKLLAYLQAEAIPVITPALLLPEVAGAISRGSKNAELARQFVEKYAGLPHLVFVALDLILARQSAGLAADNHLRGADAVYVSAALRFGSPLITRDKEQYARSAPAVKTRTPEEALEELGLS